MDKQPNINYYYRQLQQSSQMLDKLRDENFPGKLKAIRYHYSLYLQAERIIYNYFTNISTQTK